MLTEIEHVRQVKGEPLRRWFADSDFDLIVWVGMHTEIDGFQLCYRVGNRQKALTWRQTSGFVLTGIDDGESVPGTHKATPILTPDPVAEAAGLGYRFVRSSHTLPAAIAEFVNRRISEYEERRRSIPGASSGLEGKP